MISEANLSRIIGLPIAGMLSLAISYPAYSQSLCLGLGKFKMEQSDDRFSSDDSTTVAGRNNRISKKSIIGGTHIGCDGMFVEPVAIKRRSDNSLIAVSFYIHNEASSDTTYGNPNTIGTPRRIAFVTGEGQPISLSIHNGDTKWGRVTYNSISQSASSEIRETGIAELTPVQFNRIISSTTLAVRIEGSSRSVTYETKDISKSFIPNLKSFYNAHVASDQT